MGQINAWLRRVDGGYAHWCPGCESMHVFAVDKPTEGGARWSIGSDMSSPTFQPSMNIRWGTYADHSYRPDPDDENLSGICHYWVKAGTIEFLAECTHALAGKTVPLPPLPPEHCDGPRA